MQTIKGLKLPAGKGFALKNTHVLIAGQVGISGSMKAGYVDNSLEEDNIYSADPDLPVTATSGHDRQQKWNSRTFNRRNRIVRRVHFRFAVQEHGDYMGRAGDCTFEDCTFEMNGSQGNQDAQREMDMFGGRADNVKCMLRFLRCRWIRNATPFGTRQSWASSLFAMDWNQRVSYPDGPLILTPQGNPQKGHLVRSLTDVEYIRCYFEGGGYPHTASGNRQCMSTGAILCQDRENLLIRGCTFNFDKPDREVIQIRNVANAIVEPCTWMKDGDIVLHDMARSDTHAKIATAANGAIGDIRKRPLGSHNTTFLAKLTAGYSN